MVESTNPPNFEDIKLVYKYKNHFNEMKEDEGWQISKNNARSRV